VLHTKIELLRATFSLGRWFWGFTDNAILTVATETLEAV